MPVRKTKHSEVIDLNKHRKRRDQPMITVPATARPPLTDLPAVVVKTRRGRTAEIINLPMRSAGADMVLLLIRLHPDGSLFTRDDDYVRIRDIAAVVDPKRGETEVEAAHREAVADPAPLRPIEVKIGTRDERVGLMNIPDTAEGAAIFRYILQEFRKGRDGQPSGYTFYTTDGGYIPVHEIAAANLPPKRGSDDENPSR